MHPLAAILISLAVTGPSGTSAADSAKSAQSLRIEQCEVTLIRYAQVPARQPGVLEQVPVEENQMVAKDQLLAQIDNVDAVLRREAAVREYEAAAEQAKENVDAQAAAAAADVARAELEDSQYINNRAPGAIPPTEVRRQELTAERARLQIKVADTEFAVAGFTSKAQQAKVNVIEHEIKVRQVLAPFAGLVVERYRQEGEWVQAGDPVVRIVQMDKLRAQGFLEAKDFAPHEIEGRPVTIVVDMPGGRQHEIKSRVSYVSQVVEASNEYRVWAEIENVQVETRDNRVFWLLRPGMSATMLIDVSAVRR